MYATLLCLHVFHNNLPSCEVYTHFINNYDLLHFLMLNTIITFPHNFLHR